jgi:hypothetical protein
MLAFLAIGTAEGAPRLKIAPAILAQPASQVALNIELERSEPLSNNGFIRFRGLPPSVSFAEGFAIGPGVWAVPLVGLATLKIHVPVGVSGRSTFDISLVDAEGKVLAEATSELVIERGTALTDQRAAARSQQHTAFTYRPAGFPPPPRPFAERSDPQVEHLLAAGQRYLAHGNIAAARAFFRRAADAGAAAGATLLAATYDAVALQRLNVVGPIADRDEALRWYQRARQLGAADDAIHGTGCKC